MPWELDGNILSNPPTEFLGTTNNQPLAIKTDNAERIRVTPEGNVGIGTGTPRRKLHVEPSEIHSGGSGAGFSFGNRQDLFTRQPSPFTENPTAGERWVWYATGGTARLWSGTDKIDISTDGSLRTQGTVNSLEDVTALGDVTADGALVGDTVNVFTDVTAGGNVNVVGDVNATHGRFGTSSGTAVFGTSSNGPGVKGESTNNFGVQGTSTNGFGVKGESTNSTGVKGTSDRGSGVSGESTGYIGVFGSGGPNAGPLLIEASVAGVVGVSSSDPNAGPLLIETSVAGVVGVSSSDIGVEGISISRDGVVGRSISGSGVKGESTGGTDRSIGVSGTTDSGFAGVSGTSIFGFGVRGFSPSNFGVVGRSTTSSGVSGSSSSGSGVSGSSSSGSGVRGRGAPGGYFDGGLVVVNGNKTFKIDHPLDPENKYLLHNAVESSERKNVYDGIALTDEKGVAWVELPEWFEALNGDFRYQLTAIGTPVPQLHVAEEIKQSRFKIAGGQAGMKVCWQVTGSRKDPWAAANPFEVEQDKPKGERGRYLAPSLYGASEEQRVIIGEPVTEAEATVPPSFDFAHLEEERQRQLDESRRLLEEQRLEMDERRRRMERQEEAPPEST